MADKTRLVILGAGALGSNWAKVVAASPDAELVGFVDPFFGTDTAPQWVSSYAGVPTAKTLSELGDVAADAAIVTAQSPAHASAIEAALDRGLHVVVEKPFATTLTDAERLVEYAADKGLTLMVSQNYRFFPGVTRLREAVRDETYGRIRAVAGWFSHDWAGKPYQHAMEHITPLEMSVHHMDMVRAIFDSEAADGLTVEWNTKASQYRGGGGQEALYRMLSERDSFPFLYSGTLLGKSRNVPWAGYWRFQFDDATLVAETIDGRYGLYRATGEAEEYLGEWTADVGFGPSLAHFLESLRNGTEPWSSGRNNLGTLKMALGFEQPASAAR